MWLDRLREMKAESELTTKEISEKSGIPEPTLEKLFAGATKDPKLATMQQLVHFLGFTLDDLSEEPKSSETFSREEKAHIKKYRLLDPYGKEAVDGVLDVEYRRCQAEKQEKDRQARAAAELKAQREKPEAAAEPVIQIMHFSVPYQLHPMSAGTGQPAEGEYTENLLLIREPPHGTSYIARVSGDSMEPTYYDGDRVFVYSTFEIRPGQVGVFLMDGEQFIKELGDGELISHNPTYPPRKITPGTRCQGLILGVCDESYFE